MERFQYFIFFLFLCIFIGPHDAYADQLKLKDGSTLSYQSVFSTDEEGVTLLIENGITHIPWQNLLDKDANILSQGKYKKWILEKQKRLEAQKKVMELQKYQGETLPQTPTKTRDASSQEDRKIPRKNTRDQDEYEEEWQPSSYRYM